MPGAQFGCFWICFATFTFFSTQDATRAAVLIADSNGTRGVSRYRESDAASSGVVAHGGEFIYGQSLGPDGNLYIVAEDISPSASAGEILRFNPVTGAPMGALVPLGQNGLSGFTGVD